MGFSVIGLALASALLAPNLLFAFLPARNIPPQRADAGPVFVLLERLGQVACVGLLIFSGGELGGADLRTTGFALAAVCITVYWGLWIRYFAGGRDFRLLSAPLGPVPGPIAIFPILAFAFSAVGARSLWLGIAVVIFAIGHLANSRIMSRS